MTKFKNLIPLALLALILSGCSLSSKNSVENTAPAKEDEQSGSFSFKELIAQGKNQQCSITTTSTDDGITTTAEGVVYISGQKIYQEATIKTSDGVNQSYRAISDGTYLYTYDPANKESGLKLKVVDSEGDTGSGDARGTASFDDKVNVKCRPWIPNQSVFTPPQDVKFTDLSEMLDSLPQNPAIPQN